MIKKTSRKIKEAIKNNLPDLITEENIVMSNGREVVKIPIKSLDEYRIRYNYDKTNMWVKVMETVKLGM